MLKKSLFGLVALVLLFGVASCFSSNNESPVVNKLNQSEGLSLSTYLASGFLQTGKKNDNQTLASSRNIRRSNWKTTEALEFEHELDEVNAYFNQLKVFLDNGVDNVLKVEEKASTLEGYQYEMAYTIDGITYTIYYSMFEEIDDNDEDADDLDVEEEKELDIDDVEAYYRLEGLMIIDGIEFILTGARELEDDEVETWFKTVDKKNSANYVYVEIEQEADEQEFIIETMINGVKSKTKLEFETEDNETKVSLKLVNDGKESNYKFQKEVEDGITFYKFTYRIGDVKGSVKVIELTDAEGNVTYVYKIKENGKDKEIEKPVNNDSNDDDEVEEE